MNVLITHGGRRLTVRHRFVAAVQELEPDEQLGPLCRVHFGAMRGAAYVVRGTFEDVTAAIGLAPTDSPAAPTEEEPR
jgi:hypothetical protein